MELVVDAGNFSVKIGLFKGNRLVLRIASSYALLPSAARSLPEYDRGLVVSVAYELDGYLLRLFPKTRPLVPSRLPIPTRYSPSTLGPDRLAAAYPFIRRRENAIVVVCGSAITVNVVKDGVFLGGPILPSFHRLRSAYLSLSMMARRLHPDSRRAIEEGVRYAVLGGVREVIRDVERRFGIRRKYLTGGCVHELKVGGKVLPDLVLFGGRMLLEEFWDLGLSSPPSHPL